MKPITQEAPMGCAIACGASLTNLSYKQMRKYFDKGETREHTSGFFGKDIISALNKLEISAKSCSIKRFGNRKMKLGTIVFVGGSKKYPEGHYLLKTKKGWMNPWANYPSINPARAGFQRTLPDKISWVIETTK